jgi:Tetratricopeptide repeat
LRIAPPGAVAIELQVGAGFRHYLATSPAILRLLRATNRLSEAEPLYRRALLIFERSFGRDHPSTITVRTNLSRLSPKKANGGPGDIYLTTMAVELGFRIGNQKR